MTTQKQKELLQQIGLHKNEANLYLASLRLGPASAIQLGQKIGVTRQMVYEVLPVLISKGLIKQVEIGSRNLFQAVSPEILEDRAKDIAQEIKEIVPILKSQQAEFAAIPLITVYENPIAMREWYRQYMKEAKKGDEILIWSSGNADVWYRMDKEFYDQYMDFNDKTEVITYLIEPDNEKTKIHDKLIDRKHNRYKRFKDAWKANAEKWIWKNQVCYLTIRENATNMIVIESKDLAEIERFDFWRIWKP